MNIYISSNDVLLVKELIMHKNVEVCGYLLSANEMKNDDKLAPFYPREINRLILYTDKIGNSNSCQTSKYTKIIWHTHSNMSKGYPSANDIIIPLIEDVETSIIFTKWGVWEIHSDKPYKINKKEFSSKVQAALDWIYKNTNNGRTDFLSSDQLDLMAKTIKKLLDYLQSQGINLKISFSDWRQIGNKPYVLLYST